MKVELYGEGESARLLLDVPRDSFDAVHNWLEQAGFHVKWPAVRPAGSYGTIILLPRDPDAPELSEPGDSDG